MINYFGKYSYANFKVLCYLYFSPYDDIYRHYDVNGVYVFDDDAHYFYNLSLHLGFLKSLY